MVKYTDIYSIKWPTKTFYLFRYQCNRKCGVIYTIKFCVELKKTKQEAYGEEQMSKASFYRWFSKGNDQVEDETRSGAPKKARKEENIHEVERLVFKRSSNVCKNDI